MSHYVPHVHLKLTILLPQLPGIIDMYHHAQLNFFLFFFVYMGGTWSLNSELHASKADTLLLEPNLQSIFALVILEMGSCKLFSPGWP
jgi:hypothetical protein